MFLLFLERFKGEKDVVCLIPRTRVSNFWQIMTKKKVGSFLVLEDDKLVVIVTSSDIMHSFGIFKDIKD